MISLHMNHEHALSCTTTPPHTHTHTLTHTHSHSGDIHEEKVWSNEESLRAVCAVRLRDSVDHLQHDEPSVSVRQLRHGQGAAQVHRIQRTPRESHQ